LPLCGRADFFVNPARRRPFFDLVEHAPVEGSTGPVAAAQHPMPVTHHGAVHLGETPKVSGDAVSNRGLDIAMRSAPVYADEAYSREGKQRRYEPA